MIIRCTQIPAPNLITIQGIADHITGGEGSIDIATIGSHGGSSKTNAGINIIEVKIIIRLQHIRHSFGPEQLTTFIIVAINFTGVFIAATDEQSVLNNNR